MLAFARAHVDEARRGLALRNRRSGPGIEVRHEIEAYPDLPGAIMP